MRNYFAFQLRITHYELRISHCSSLPRGDTMNQVHEIAFRINASMNPAAYAAFRNAQQAMAGLSRQAQLASVQMSASSASTAARLGELQKSSAAFQKYHTLSQAVKEFTQQTAEAKNKAREMLAQYQASQRQTDAMKQSLQRLIEVRRTEKQNMSTEQYKIIGQQIKQARQELKAQENITKQLQQGYQRAQTAADKLNSKLKSQQQELEALKQSFQSAGISAQEMASREAQLQSQIQRTTQALERQRNADLARNRQQEASQNLFNAYGNFQNAIGTAESIMSPFKNAVQTYATFEQSMSKVKALSQANEAEFAKLTEQAEYLGATTQFTAKQSADAMSYLAMSGWAMLTLCILKKVQTQR